MTAPSPLPMKLGAVCSWTLGLGFGLPCAYGIWHLVRYGDIATFLGFPTYGRGPLENAGVPTTVPLLAGFLTVCAAEVGAGWLLWTGRRAGIAMAFALLPFEAVFWIGFDLPYGPPIGVARTVAVLAAVRPKRPSEALSKVE